MGKFVIFYRLRAAFRLMKTLLRIDMDWRKRGVQALQLPTNMQLNAAEKKRIRYYFLLAGFAQAVYCHMRGQKPTPKEQLLWQNFAALTAFFDDLADSFAQKNDTKNLKEIENFGKIADQRGIANFLYDKVKTNIKPQKLSEFEQLAQQIFELEAAGNQLNTNLSLQKITQLTQQKGGWSTLIFRQLLQHDWKENEREAIFEFGYLVQLCDDITDVWSDVNENITTLPVVLLRQNKVSDLKILFENQVIKTENCFLLLDYKPQNLKTAFQMTIFLVNIARLAMLNYEKLIQKYGAIPFQSRKEMVLDMEKFGNRIKFIQLFFTA
ncbi:MAG: hypothetical protein RL757_2073 [Bacteroidota bacterium]|jgi:hypothetical protein